MNQRRQSEEILDHSFLRQQDDRGWIGQYMGVRKKGRSKFHHSGIEFVWWVDHDTYIRIASADKSLVVAYLIYDVPKEVGGILAVHGPSSPGIERNGKRPIWLVVPHEITDAFQHSMGAFVDALI